MRTVTNKVEMILKQVKSSMSIQEHQEMTAKTEVELAAPRGWSKLVAGVLGLTSIGSLIRNIGYQLAVIMHPAMRYIGLMSKEVETSVPTPESLSDNRPRARN